jgi:hypothetical protein
MFCLTNIYNHYIFMEYTLIEQSCYFEKDVSRQYGIY